MADIDRLADELTVDPEGIGYSGMTDDEAVASLNAQNREYSVEVSSRTLLVWAGGNGRLKKIDAARTNSAVPAGIQNVCEVAMRLIERDEASYDPNDPRHTGMLDALVSSGVIDQSDADALNALGVRLRSRAQEKQIGTVKTGHVQEARRNG